MHRDFNMFPELMRFNRDQLKSSVARLAEKGVFLGTSSWKYPGWCGQLYDEGRYVWQRRFSESRFNRLCLAEYAEVFKSVCVDAAYYKFPDARSIENLVSQVPPDFLFAFKVTDDITLKRFPQLSRFGLRAGQSNDNFLSAELFASAYLAPCQPYRRQIGLLIFEFSRFWPNDFTSGRDFVEALDKFLGSLPKDWPYGVEIRNPNFLHPDYFATLTQHGVTHVYNSWAEMPSLNEQLALPGSRTCAEFVGVRLLLKPGRKYEEAVALFSPYNEIKDPYPEGRLAATSLLRQVRAAGGRSKAFIYVNNRFEGNALQTIQAIVDMLD